jgi:hypothetical protein
MDGEKPTPVEETVTALLLRYEEFAAFTGQDAAFSYQNVDAPTASTHLELGRRR